MKRIALFLLLQLTFLSQVLAVPSSSMSVSPSATSGQTISASDENSRNNSISSTFNSHTHTDITSLGTVTTGLWNGTDISSAYVDNFNPQSLTSSSAITEGAGSLTTVDFGATDTITATIDGSQTVFLVFNCTYSNNDITGANGVNIQITDDSNNIIGSSDRSYTAAVAGEAYSATTFAIDTRPTSGTKVYQVRFQRSTGGTVTLTERSFIAFTLPDPS